MKARVELRKLYPSLHPRSIRAAVHGEVGGLGGVKDAALLLDPRETAHGERLVHQVCVDVG
jgi:hypothetical protein